MQNNIRRGDLCVLRLDIGPHVTGSSALCLEDAERYFFRTFLMSDGTTSYLASSELELIKGYDGEGQ